MRKDRYREIVVADGIKIVVERSSGHPVEYAIMLLAYRDGAWRNVCTFDNAHDPEEHHEHGYIGDDKEPPDVTYGPVNEAMDRALLKLRESWADIVGIWEITR